MERWLHNFSCKKSSSAKYELDLYLWGLQGQIKGMFTSLTPTALCVIWVISGMVRVLDCWSE